VRRKFLLLLEMGLILAGLALGWSAWKVNSVLEQPLHVTQERLLDVPNGTSAGSPLTLIAYVYYPGPNGQPTWATASGAYGSGTVTMDLLQVSNGFCRSCTPPAQLSGTKIGSMSLSFDPPNPGRGYTTGTASITANYPGAGGFNRSNIPISMLSVPTGQ